MEPKPHVSFYQGSLGITRTTHYPTQNG